MTLPSLYVLDADFQQQARVPDRVVNGLIERQEKITELAARCGAIERPNDRVKGPEAASPPKAPSRLTGYAEGGK